VISTKPVLFSSLMTSEAPFGGYREPITGELALSTRSLHSNQYPISTFIPNKAESKDALVPGRPCLPLRDKEETILRIFGSCVD